MRVEAQDARSGSAGSAEIADAARVLAALGLVTGFGHISARAGDRLLITPAAALDQVRDRDLVTVPLDATELPAGAPAESWIHLCVYAVWPDVMAVVRAQPPGAAAAAAVATALTPLHGQASWLGRVVPVHDDARLLRSAELASRAAVALGRADALLLRGNGAITTASSPGIAVARMWLLSTACQAWLTASAAGPFRPLTDAEVDSWRAVQDELLPRLWRHLWRTALDDAEAGRD